MKFIFVLCIAFVIALVPSQGSSSDEKATVSATVSATIQNAINSVADFAPNIEALFYEFNSLAMQVGADSIIPIIIGQTTLTDVFHSLHNLYQSYSQQATEVAQEYFHNGLNSLDVISQHVFSILQTTSDEASYQNVLNAVSSFITNLLKPLLADFYNNFDDVIDYFNSKFDQLHTDIKDVLAGSVMALLSGSTTPEEIWLNSVDKLHEYVVDFIQYAITDSSEKTHVLFNQINALFEVIQNQFEEIANEGLAQLIDDFREAAMQVGEDAIYPILYGQTTVNEVLDDVFTTVKVHIQRAIQTIISAYLFALNDLGPEFQLLKPPQPQRTDALVSKESNVVISFIINAVKQALLYVNNIFEFYVTILKTSNDPLVAEIDSIVRRYAYHLSIGFITKRQIVEYTVQSIQSFMFVSFINGAVYVSRILLILYTQYKPLVEKAFEFLQQFDNIDLLVDTIQYFFQPFVDMALNTAYAEPWPFYG